MTTVRIPEKATPDQIAQCLEKIKDISENTIYAHRLPFPEREMTIMVGEFKDPDAIERRLSADDFLVGAIARKLLRTQDYKSATERVPIRVGVFSGMELGFAGNYSYKELISRVSAFGLRPLISEAGVSLRSVYVNQPFGERVYVVSRPLRYRGDYYLFCVDNSGGGRYLSSVKVTEKSSFEPRCRWAVW